MKRLPPVVLLLAALACAAPAHAKEAPPKAAEAGKKTITLATDPWCPYSCEPDTDKPGILIEIAQRTFAKAGLPIKYVKMPWIRAIEESRKGKWNAVVGAARSDAPDFIFPDNEQGHMHAMFYVRPDSAWEYKGVASLQGQRFAGIAAYAYDAELNAYMDKYKNDPTKVQVSSGDNAGEININKLLAGRIDVLIEDLNVMKMYMQSHPEIKNKLKTAGELPESDNNLLHLAFSPADPESKHYAALVAAETRELEKSGEMKKIYAKYLGDSAE